MADLNRRVGGLRCRDVLDLLADFVDGELTAGALEQVTAHLGGCDTCEKFGGEYGALVVDLRAGRPPRPVQSGVRTRLADRMARFWEESEV